MSRLSDRVLDLQEAATLKMAQLARELRASGKDVISLTIGEPDFATPEHIRRAAKEAIDAGYNKYTPVPGYPELREAICTKLERDNGLQYSPAQIVVSTGAKQSLMNVCLAMLNPGDEAVLLAPYWVSYFEMVRFAGATPVVVDAPVGQDYKITAAQLEAAITPRTRLVIVNSPCNPTGSVYSGDELAAIARVVAAHDGVYLVSDEIYEYITFSTPHVSLASFPGMAERVITVNGMSKGFAMTGWRLGYLAAPGWLAAATAKIQGQFTSGANSIAQRASIAALLGDLTPTREMTTAYLERKNLARDLLRQIPGLVTNDPQGAFYVFPDASHYIGMHYQGRAVADSDVLCDIFLRDANVALVPGNAFGAGSCFRISCAASASEIRNGIERIAAVLEKFE